MNGREVLKVAMYYRKVTETELGKMLGTSQRAVWDLIDTNHKWDIQCDKLVGALKALEFDLIAVPKDYKPGGLLFPIDGECNQPLPCRPWRVRVADERVKKMKQPPKIVSERIKSSEDK